MGRSPSDVVKTVAIGAGPAFEMRRGLGSTVDQVASADRATVAAAYSGVARVYGLHPDAEPKRAAVVYAVQQRWYEETFAEGEPPAVKTRREALYGMMRKPAVGRIVEPRSAPQGQSTAEAIRKGLLDGASTADILQVVKLLNPQAKADAAAVAYYRHQLRKRGELPPAVDSTGKTIKGGQR